MLPLVEIVQTQLVDQQVVEHAESFARRIGKEPIRCNDTPGFVVNRILVPLLNDCVRMLDETGVTPKDLDVAMEAGATFAILFRLLLVYPTGRFENRFHTGLALSSYCVVLILRLSEFLFYDPAEDGCSNCPENAARRIPPSHQDWPKNPT